MSADPAINAAILNMCAQLRPLDNNNNNTTNNTEGTNPTATAVAPAAGGLMVLPNEEAKTVEPGVSPEQQAAAIKRFVPTDRAPEDYEFLRQAMASVEAPERRVKRLLETIDVLSPKTLPPPTTNSNDNENKKDKEEEEEEEEDKLLEALEELSDMVEDINWAMEFHLLDGPRRVLQLLKPLFPPSPFTYEDVNDHHKNHNKSNNNNKYIYGSNVEALTQLLHIIAHSAQLNETLQESYKKAKWQEYIMPFFSYFLMCKENNITEEGNDGKKDILLNYTVLAAALHACSSICRSHAMNTLVFIQAEGMVVLTRLTNIMRAHFDVQMDDYYFNNNSINNEGPKQFHYRHHLNIQKFRAVVKILNRVLFFAAYLAEENMTSQSFVVSVLHVLCTAEATRQELTFLHEHHQQQQQQQSSSNPHVIRSQNEAAASSSPAAAEEEEEETNNEKEMKEEQLALLEKSVANVLLELLAKSPKLIHKMIKEEEFPIITIQDLIQEEQELNNNNNVVGEKKEKERVTAMDVVRRWKKELQKDDQSDDKRVQLFTALEKQS